jgi:hypothetical protein
MEKEQIKTKILEFFRLQLNPQQANQHSEIQMGQIYHLFDAEIRQIGQSQ